ncbi:MAG TPA: DNA-3-methyladenine glycosylase [Nitrososphaeraceae archaeon]|nr:DNA-3-methyladenine glycosylase [Nitrososphaeraceae archaeon]
MTVEEEGNVIIKYLSQSDPCLGEVIRTVGKYSIKIHNDPFQSLVKSIIYQQLAGRVAGVIYGRFIKYYNDSPPLPEQILSTPDSVLKSLIGLSTKKVQYIKDLSARVTERKLDLVMLSEMKDDEIIVQLMQVKGIGRWTAEMFLIFCLGRLDVLPVTDLGVRKAMQKIYSLPNLPKQSEMLAISQPWKPYRSVATWYLWKSMFNSIG